jgi:hypothetical protein
MTKCSWGRPVHRRASRTIEYKNRRFGLMSPLWKRRPRRLRPSKAELREDLASALLETAKRQAERR